MSDTNRGTPASRRRRASSLLAALVALLAAGCGAPDTAGPPADAPTATPTATAAPTPTTTTKAPRDAACRASLDAATGRFSSEGGSAGQVRSNDDGVFFGCAGGPLVQAQIDPGSALVLTLDGTETRIPDGASETVGPYEARVTSIDGDALTFELELTDVV